VNGREKENIYFVITARELEGKRLLGIPKRRWMDNIKIALGGI
jgi:hypothetical protein